MVTANTLPTSYVIAEMLIENLASGTLPSANAANPVFINHEPDKPDTCIVVYDTPGIEESRGMQGDRVTHNGIRVRVRSKNYLTAWQLINSINTAFAGIANEAVIVNTYTYTVNTITSTSAIVTLGPTGQRILNKFTKNFIVSMTNR